MSKACEDCAFFVEASPDRDADGECRRFPPSLAATKRQELDNVYLGVFPDVNDNYWCGEFQPRGGAGSARGVLPMPLLSLGNLKPSTDWGATSAD